MNICPKMLPAEVIAQKKYISFIFKNIGKPFFPKFGSLTHISMQKLIAIV